MEEEARDDEPTTSIQNYVFNFLVAHMDSQLSLVNKTDDANAMHFRVIHNHGGVLANQY